MALFITLGLISRPSAKMLSLAQHTDYAQHLSVYAVSCTVWTGVIPSDILVPHIDSRVKIIDNERPGAGPCDLLLVIVRVL